MKGIQKTRAGAALAEFLLAQRKTRKMNTNEFVDACGVSGTIVLRLLTERVDPRLSTIERVAARLGHTASEAITTTKKGKKAATHDKA